MSSPAPGGSSTCVVSPRPRGGECVLTLEYELDDDDEAADEFGTPAVELDDRAGGAASAGTDSCTATGRRPQKHESIMRRARSAIANGAAKSAGYLNAYDKRHSHHGLAAVLILVCSLAFTTLMLALPVFVPPYDPWPTPLGNRTSYTFVESGVRTYTDG